MDTGEHPAPKNCELCGRPTSETAQRSIAAGRFCSSGCRDVFETLEEPATDATPGGSKGVKPSAAESSEAARVVGAPTRSERASGPDTGDRTVSTFFRVDGMHRRTCETFLEGIAEAHDGVADAEASYVTETIRVDHDPDRCSASDLQDALSTVGYTAYQRSDAADADENTTGTTRRARERSGTRKRRFEDMIDARYILGIVFGSFLLVPYVALLYPVHLSAFYEGGVIGLYAETFDGGVGLLFLRVYFVLTGIVLYFTGLPVLRGAYVALRTRQPNADVLVSVTIVAAFVYSTIAALAGGIDIYYDLTIVVAAAVMTATYYEATVKRRGMDLLTELTISQVDAARRYDESGSTQEVPTDDLEPGDRVLVRRGERIPVDGTLAEGECTVDEAVVTGESLPVAKRAGDPVVGGSIVTGDAAVVAAGENPTSGIERLTQTVWNLQSADHGIQRRADRHAGVAILAVAAAAALVAVASLVFGSGPTETLLATLLAILVVCPWALGLATPLSVASSLDEAIDRGIVIFDDTVFERLRGVDVVVFDKTGTLTTGEMVVHEADAPEDALAAVAALERRASHPVARAIVDAFSAESGEGRPRVDGGDDPGDRTATEPRRDDEGAPSVENFTAHATGVGGTVDGTEVLAGTLDLFASRGWTVPEAIETRAETSRSAGRLPVVVGRDGVAEGVVVVGDEPRDGWERTIAGLSERGIDVVVLTGDDASAATAFEDHPHVDEVFANVPPAGKTAAVRRLRSRGRVAMVGDGTNDAPALAAADLGISLGSGTDLASDAADLSILGDDLDAVETAFELGVAARTRVRQNVGLALVYNAVAIPAAVLGLLNPLSAMVAAVASILLLLWNASRALVVP